MRLNNVQIEDPLLTIRGRKHKKVRTNAFTIPVFKEVLDRLYTALGVHTKRELAAALGRSFATVHEALKARHIPFTWLNILHDNYGIREMWLLTGVGDMRCPKCKSTSIRRASMRPLSEYSDLELRTELILREQRRGIYRFNKLPANKFEGHEPSCKQ